MTAAGAPAAPIEPYLITLITCWRERAGYLQCDSTGTTTHGEVQKCADELGFVLRTVLQGIYE